MKKIVALCVLFIFLIGIVPVIAIEDTPDRKKPELRERLADAKEKAPELREKAKERMENVKETREKIQKIKRNTEELHKRAKELRERFQEASDKVKEQRDRVKELREKAEKCKEDSEDCNKQREEWRKGWLTKLERISDVLTKSLELKLLFIASRWLFLLYLKQLVSFLSSFLMLKIPTV